MSTHAETWTGDRSTLSGAHDYIGFLQRQNNQLGIRAEELEKEVERQYNMLAAMFWHLPNNKLCGEIRQTFLKYEKEEFPLRAIARRTV